MKYLIIRMVLGLVATAFFHSSYTSHILVTGGAGFIGSNFINYLSQHHPDYHITVLDKLTYAGNITNIAPEVRHSNKFTFIHGSINDFELVDSLLASVDFVVHFAAESHVPRSIADDFIFFETDVMGTRSLMAACVKHKRTLKRIIHISTSEVYGTAQTFFMSEDHPLNPHTPYAAAKAGADRLVYAYGCTYDLPLVIVRPFNNYGPCQHVEKLIPRFIAQAIQGLPLTIHGNGEQKRDWVHTQDIARALDIILHTENFERIRKQVINLGSGIPISINEIADIILDYFKLPTTQKKYTKDRPGQVMLHISTTNKALELLGWEPKIKFNEGIKETISWYITHPDHWQEEVKNCLIPLAVNDAHVEMY